VRGGGEKGRKWQEDGTHEHKMNGIHDLEACAHLVDHKLSSSSHLAARGGSMGGVLGVPAAVARPRAVASVRRPRASGGPTRLDETRPAS
jgi:protease II